MHRTAKALGLTLMLAALAGQPALAGDIGGTIKVGAITKDETAGDLTAIQETANIFDGFSLSQIQLDGRLSDRATFDLDLREINLDSRRGLFHCRVADLGRLDFNYDKHRQIYDMAGSAFSEREAWLRGTSLAPRPWLRVSADYGRQTRTGDRLSLPAGTASFLGASYDYTLDTGRYEVEARKEGRSLAVGLETSSFSDADLAAAERTGTLVSLRASSPCYFLPGKLTHFARAAFGKQELSRAELDYSLSSFQYLGTLRPSRSLQARYDLDLVRIENDATGVQTDRITNNLDLTWFNELGSVWAGGGVVNADDDYSLTQDVIWRVGGSAGFGPGLRAKLAYAASNLTDQENLTLLKDVTTSRLTASLSSRPTERLTLGASYVDRTREYPVLGVKATGARTGLNGRYELPGLGALQVDLTYSDDEYDDLDAGFAADNRTVSGRLDIEAVRDLRLTAGVTYLNLGKDLDIEKSILSFEGNYTFQKDYFVEVKYNVYNYDDYVLLDRYYTANVVWMNIGYKLSID